MTIVIEVNLISGALSLSFLLFTHRTIVLGRTASAVGYMKLLMGRCGLLCENYLKKYNTNQQQLRQLKQRQCLYG